MDMKGGLNGIRNNARKHSDGSSELGIGWEVGCTMCTYALSFVHCPPSTTDGKQWEATGQGLGLALGMWDLDYPFPYQPAHIFPWDFRYILSACPVLMI